MDPTVQVSIICNAYNHEKYIRDALEGFVNQKTNFAFEVLIHDDASTDGTAEIIREYEEKYPSIIKPIYQTENQYSKRIGIDRTFQKPRAKRKYVAMCEGDDYWTDPLKLQKQYDFMEAHPEYSLCICSTDWYNIKTGHLENRGRIKEDRDISLKEIILEENGRIFQYATVFMKTDVWVGMPLWCRAFPIGDYPLALNAALNGKVRMLADTMAVYRFYSKNSWTVRMDNDDARAKISRQMIEGLDAFNEATDHKYEEAVNKRRKRHRYMQAMMEHDLKTLHSKELEEIHKSRSALFRFSTLIRCKFPRLYEIVMKPIARMIKSAYGK
ncbi:MAG: glycosyltransferase [Clostridia bacterium]|nr:glycosyltransferase [Clostridia bacterium]